MREVLDLGGAQPGVAAEEPQVDAFRRKPGMECLQPGAVVRADRPEVDGPSVSQHGVAFVGHGIGANSHAISFAFFVAAG